MSAAHCNCKQVGVAQSTFDFSKFCWNLCSRQWKQCCPRRVSAARWWRHLLHWWIAMSIMFSGVCQCKWFSSFPR